MNLDSLRWIFAVNFFGAVHCTHAFLPMLRFASEARIVNILSGFALYGFPGKTAYCATKFALRGFSEALRSELHGTSIQVVSVYPPAVDTNIVRTGRTSNPAKRDLEVALLARHGMDVRKVAERIVTAAARGQEMVVIGPSTWLVTVASCVSPVWTARLVGALRPRIPFA